MLPSPVVMRMFPFMGCDDVAVSAGDVQIRIRWDVHGDRYGVMAVAEKMKVHGRALHVQADCVAYLAFADVHVAWNAVAVGLDVGLDFARGSGDDADVAIVGADMK
jgi:hypothetical protein